MKKHLLQILLGIFAMAATAQNVDWVRSFGNTGNEYGRSVTTDGIGNVYTTGTFTGTVDFDPGASVHNLVSTGADDIFIVKLNATGNFLWAKSFGNTGFSDRSNCIKVDSQGNVYVTGWFTGTVDFNPGPATFTLSALTGYDAFILKLDASGNFLWAANFGAHSIQINGPSLAISQAGDLYLVGYFGATVDFDPGPGTFSLTSAGVYDVFILKLNASGNFIWVKSIGDQYSEMASSVAVDGAGNVYAAGHFHSTVDFDPGASSYPLTSTGISDIFIVKLNAAGNFLWAKSMGGLSADGASSIAIDAIGNVYTTGSFSETCDFDPGPGNYPLISAGFLDVFISKLDASGNFIWAKSMGSAGEDEQGNAIAIDLKGNAYVIGRFRGTMDFNPGPGTHTVAAAGFGDVFISGFAAAGNFSWVKCLGGTSEDYGFSISSNQDNLYMTGFYAGAVDFDPGSNQFNLNSVSGSADAFILKLNSLETGIHDASANSAGLICYPNPGKGSLNIKSSAEVRLIIVNSVGQSVLTLELNADTGYRAEIQGLAPGIYFLSGESSQGAIHQKIIITD